MKIDEEKQEPEPEQNGPSRFPEFFAEETEGRLNELREKMQAEENIEESKKRKQEQREMLSILLKIRAYLSAYNEGCERVTGEHMAAVEKTEEQKDFLAAEMKRKEISRQEKTAQRSAERQVRKYRSSYHQLILAQASQDIQTLKGGDLEFVRILFRVAYSLKENTLADNEFSVVFPLMRAMHLFLTDNILESTKQKRKSDLKIAALERELFALKQQSLLLGSVNLGWQISSASSSHGKHQSCRCLHVSSDEEELKKLQEELKKLQQLKNEHVNTCNDQDEML